MHAPDFTAVDYLDALGFFYLNDIVVTFGEYRESYTEYAGYVRPLCGSVRIPVGNLSNLGQATSTGGSDMLLQWYYNSVFVAWNGSLGLHFSKFARGMVEHVVGQYNDKLWACNGTDTGGDDLVVGVATALPANAAECMNIFPLDQKFKTQMLAQYRTDLQTVVQGAWELYVTNSIQVQFNAEIRGYGWGGAGVWYNKIAEINGGWMDSVRSVPYMDSYPEVMEKVRAINKQVNENQETGKMFEPSQKAPGATEGSKKIEISAEEVDLIAKPLNAVFQFWNNENRKVPDNLRRVTFQNAFMDAMNRLLGTTGLASMRTSNRHLHPLAQLVAVGKGLVNAAVFDLAASSVTAFLGGMLGALEGYGDSAAVASAASKAFLSIAFLGLTAGFVLFYVLPFLPFIYFYFAVASWLKTIFEAMVGVPLWALAHLRIDGEGLPGDAAQNGYFLILEIFIRPILTVVGLIAAMGVFAVQVQILGVIWDLVVSNTGGYTSDINALGMDRPDDTRHHRGIIDQFFFTVIYAVICYMMALASFKLIDKIPDNILRWAGAGVSAFGDIDQESVESISRYATAGGMTIGNQAAGALTETSGGLGSSLGALLKK